MVRLLLLDQIEFVKPRLCLHALRQARPPCPPVPAWIMDRGQAAC
jgi:hypothetical protein